MPLDTSPETLLKLQTERRMVRAQYKDLTYNIRRRVLVDHARLEAHIFALAHRVRDQLLTAPARHSALLAAEAGLNPGALAAALDAAMRASLREIAAGRG